jgi:hypothetical protein
MDDGSREGGLLFAFRFRQITGYLAKERNGVGDEAPFPLSTVHEMPGV